MFQYRLLISICAVWLCMSGGLSGQEQVRLPVPSTDQVKQANVLIDQSFATDIEKAKSNSQKSELAEKLLAQAVESQDDPAEEYALARRGAELAAAAKDPAGVMDCLRFLAHRFDSQFGELAIESLEKATPTSVAIGQNVKFVTACAEAVETVLSNDEFEAARRLITLAQDRLSATKEKRMEQRISTLKAEIERQEQDWKDYLTAQQTLEKSPQDPQANSVVGKYLCWYRADWKGGISALAVGRDQGLRELAQREAKAELEASDHVALGDQWWDLADKATTIARRNLVEHAATHYREALPGLKGLTHDKVEKRLAELTSPETIAAKSKASDKSKVSEGEAKAVALFDGRSLKGWKVHDPAAKNVWTARAGELIAAQQKGGASLVTESEYRDFELHLEFMLPPGGNSGVFLRGRYEVQLFDTQRPVAPNRSCGSIYGQAAPLQSVYLGAGKWNVLDVKLVGPDVTVTMNQTKIIDQFTLTVPTNAIFDNRPVSEPGAIILQHQGSALRFKNIRLRELKP